MSRRWSIIPFIYLLQNPLLGFLDPCVTCTDRLADLSEAKEKEAATGCKRQQKTGCNFLPGYNTPIMRPFKTGLDITPYFVKTGLMLWVELRSLP